MRAKTESAAHFLRAVQEPGPEPADPTEQLLRTLSRHERPMDVAILVQESGLAVGNFFNALERTENLGLTKVVVPTGSAADNKKVCLTEAGRLTITPSP